MPDTKTIPTLDELRADAISTLKKMAAHDLALYAPMYREANLKGKDCVRFRQVLRDIVNDLDLDR